MGSRFEPGRAPVVAAIIGPGHSGSTLLELLLDSHPEVFGAGEMKLLPRRVTNPTRKRNFDRCACNTSPFTHCPIWSHVGKELARTGSSSFGDLRLAPTMDAEGETDDGRLFAAIAAATGAAVIVDSSKSPSRLTALGAAGVDVRAIVLSRHVGGVAGSWHRRGASWSKAATRTAAVIAASRVAARPFPHLEITYEALATDPARWVRTVTEWLGLDFREDQLAFRATTHHMLGGNRIRFGSDDNIRLDDRWRSSSSTPQRAGAAVLQASTRLPIGLLSPLVGVAGTLGAKRFID